MSSSLNSPSNVATPSKRELLAEQLRKAAAAETTPLSFAQQRLWFLDQLEPNSPLYNVPVVVRMSGRLNVDSLRQALDAVVARHEILRTRFVSVDGTPSQVVDEAARVEMEIRDFTPLPENQRETRAQEHVRAEVNRPFNLSSGPLARATLLRLRPDEHWFVLNFHHIVSDEWSLKICFQELTELYAAACEGSAPGLPELPIQYADYTLWQRDLLEEFESQFGYWQHQLGGNLPVLELPADRPRPATPSFRGANASRVLPAELTGAVQTLAARHGGTVFMTLLAAFQALLHRCTGQADILVGSPVAGRNQLETEPLIGFFVNTLILRTDLAGDPAFGELLRRVRETVLGAQAHQDLPFEKLVEKFRPERTLSHMPFTRVMFSLQNNFFSELRWPELTLQFLEVESDTAKFELTFTVQETARGLIARAEYNRDLFDADTIDRLLQHFEVLLAGAAANPALRLSELPLLTETERHQLLVEWNQTATEYPRAACIHLLFEIQAALTPTAVAVRYDDHSITCRELNERANQLARRLQKLSVGPDVPVGICLDRSIEMIVGLLAILKAGGAYVPLDAAYPKDRLAFMVTDARMPVLLTLQRLASRFPKKGVTVICLDSDAEMIAGEDRGNLPNRVSPENLAYVMYTSGSTGQPKGVAVPHRAVVRLVRNTNYVQFRPSDRVAQVSNASFDAATFEIWGALLNGARLVGIGNDIILSPTDFARELSNSGVTVMFLTCALFNQLAADAPGAFAHMRVVMFGGEAGDPKSVRSVLQHSPPRHLVNGYGPTENTTFSVCGDVRELAADAITVSIGRPISNTLCYVLDAHLNPVPVGVPGELHLGGDGLARGYWNRPELTAEKFIRNPFVSTGDDLRSSPLLYKTGDLVRWRPDGTLECLGRIDDQVKLRGFRVELGEIETVLKRHTGIRECVVVTRECSAGKKLVAYFVSQGRRAPSVSELVRFLGEKLPDYMVPSVFIPLESLPLTPNGKVDRRALPEPGQARPLLEKRLATPRDAVEIKLTDIWESVLNVRPIGIEDKFFELGGHSLLAVRLIAQIEKAFGRKLKLATIFQAPTIEQLAAIIREEIQEGSAIAGTSLVEIQSQGSRPPIFFVHGAGGGMFWGYVNLSRCLGQDQPVYGLKSRGLDGREEYASIEEMAAQYIADIRVMQPHGPYHLGGYCFGGNVAFEMARQLHAQGEEVALLALLNSAPANSRYMKISWTPAWALRFIKNLFYWVDYCRHWSPAHRREIVRWKKEALLRRFRRVFGRRTESPGRVEAGNLVDLSSYSAEQRRLWETHIRALSQFRPRPYSGRVHLFRSPGHPLLCSFEADYGWGVVAEKGVHISVVPGVHEKILEEPCVQVMAGMLNKMMDENSAAPASTAAGEGASLDYWRQKLAGAPALMDLPADHPRPARLGSATARETISLSLEMTAAIESFSRAEGTSPGLTLLGAWQLLLARYSGSTDFVTGAAIDGKTFPLRTEWSWEPPFREFLRGLSGMAREAAVRTPVPFARLLDELKVARNTSYAPLFQVMFRFENAPGGGGAIGNEPLDLTMRFARTGDALDGWIEYNTDLFDAARISRMAAQFRTILAAAVADASRNIWQLPLLAPAETRQVLEDWNATEKEFPAHLALSQLFETQAARTPHATALVAGNERFTYEELNAWANQLAHLLHVHGVKSETLVAICLERSWRMIVAILAVLKAGGAYVPMDPAYPRDRLAFMLEDTAAPVLLTQESLNAISPPAGTQVIRLDADWNEIAAQSRENPGSQAEGRHLAYLIYTSGSTGKPKGVALEHRNAVAFVSWARDVFSAEEISGVLASTSICFDLSIFEIFVPLSRGGTVILADNALALPSLPAANEVTLINTVPSAIRELVRQKGVPASVQVVNLAGEALVTPLVDRIYGETAVRKVYDLYGPSETTTYSTFTLRRAGEPATIGRPLANEQVYLLDRHQQPVPVGVSGEIYIGGAGVARGYLNRPELTAERFVANPFRSGTKLYRTGDLGRWRADGNLEFLGRIDLQVKLRGFRIELGEIETALRRHPALRDAIVMVREDEPGDQRLTAYAVRRTEVTIDDLRRALKEKLPEYMVPTAFVFLDALPLTPNGKVDRKALPAPAPDQRIAGTPFVAPSPGVEERLAGIWREVLRVAEIGAHDNFFDLGGHSLLAMQVISRVRDAFRIELPFSTLFDRPTIAGLAEQLGSGQAAEFAAPAIRSAPRNEPLPASFVQERLWFLHQLEPGSDAYNMPMAFRLRGRLDVAALQEALNELVARHESLRTGFAYADGRVTQVIADRAPVEIEVSQMEPAENREESLRALANAEAQRPFDLARGPLLRASLFRIDENDHALLVVMHHTISDGWSLAVFFEELGALYDARAAGAPTPSLAAVTLQYADFALWKRQALQGPTLEHELHYWKSRLTGAPPALNLPTDRNEDGQGSGIAGRRVVTIAKPAAAALTSFSRHDGGSLFITLMTALAIVFEKWTQQEDMVVGTVVAGRTRREMEGVIGCFMNFLPIRTRVAPAATVRELLANVRSAVLEAQGHQDCPFEKIVEAVNPERKQNRNPLYNVALLLQNFPAEAFRTRSLEARRFPVEMRAPLLDLRFEAEQAGDELSLSCEYKADLFDADTIDCLLASCREIAEAVVANPDVKLADLRVSDALLAQARRSRDRKGEQTLVLASTFTAEPVEEPLRYWAKELGLPLRIEFAPYNQVFQQLLDPGSPLSANTRGANVLLVRLEDWFEGEPEATAVERIGREFISAVKTAASRTSTPFLIFFCPVSERTAADQPRAKILEWMESDIAGELEKLGGVQVMTASALREMYPVTDYYDANGDELGRVPYTPVFFTAIGTAIVRKFHARTRSAHKVVVLDCDQTLWAGVCGEDGPKGIRLDAPRKALQEFMRAQHDAGRLLAACSKNNEEDVREVFAQRLDMPLRHEHFTAWRLNWQPKSENLKSLAAELKLGLDSFIFVDDNPVECAEVEANCPGVTVLQLPDDPAAIPQFLKHCWVFDHLKLTEEDRNRVRMYQENQQRDQLLSGSLSLTDFLAGLDLQMEIAPMTGEQLPRVAQLTHRTNQFNCTTLRRSEGDIQRLAQGADVLAVSVRDRFGDYGLVGVMICQGIEDRLDVDTFLLSCRVLGRGVEHKMLAHLGAIARDRSLRFVDVHFHPSAKNKPAADFLQSIGAEFRQPLNGGSIYRFPTDYAVDVVFNPKDEAMAESNGRDAATPREESSTPGSKGAVRSDQFSRCRWIALHGNDAAEIHRAIEERAAHRSGRHADFIAPHSEMEKQVCALWERLLRVERVGVRDNFFELGGHSLLAVRLFAELEKLTGRKLPLVTIFQAPTAEELARALSGGDLNRWRSPIVAVREEGSRPPLFLVHGAGGDVLWGYANLAKHLPTDQPVYGIKSRGQVGLDEYDRIEDMARYYLEELRALQPEGPYYLGGYCFGGNVAYEMARQLDARGERVALLALIDASPANAGYERICWWQPAFAFRFARNCGYWLDDFRKLGFAECRRYVSRKVRTLGRKLLRKLRGQRQPERVDLEEVIDLAHFPEHELRFWQIHLDALVCHVQQPYAGAVTLIRTRGQPLFCSLKEDFCWGDLARGGVEIRMIPGSHENIFTEPHVKALAKELENCLAAGRAANGIEKELTHEPA